MKIVFMGTPDFAVSTLEKIKEAGHDVLLVVTQPDRSKGRSKDLVYSPVKEAALRLGIEVSQPEKVKDKTFINEMAEYDIDAIVVVAFGQIIPKEILDMPKYGCINVHASLLPKYRGAAPIQYAVINGDEYSGVTTMMMNEGLDTGDILIQKKVQIAPKETGGSLFDKLSTIGAEALIETLDKLKDGSITRIKQDDSESTVVSILKKSYGNIDFSKDAAEIERLIRGLSPWPSAYTKLKGKNLKIWDADVVESKQDAEIGEITDVTKESFTIACGKNSIKVNELQLEGKKRMNAKEFLRGYKIEKGTKCGE